jgi:DNA-binding CsgD family transcriptional regulator
VLDVIALGVAAGRGDEGGVARSQELRVWWANDPLVAILAGGAAIDLYGDAGDIESAVTIHDEVVIEAGAWWDASTFQARIRLSALLIGQLATAASRTAASERAGLVARGVELAEAARAAAASGRERSRHGVEGLAWLARVEAELIRLRWLAGVDPPGPQELLERWGEAVAAFEAFGHVFEIARSRARLAAAMRACGDGSGAGEQLRLARESALRLGARPLLAELRTLGRAGQRGAVQRGAGQRGAGQRGAAGSGGASSSPGEPDPLTSREREVLTLVATGRSNGEIGKALFISTKTVSVHVSNILAKLGASGRTEAAALARQRGLLDVDAAPDA